MAGELGKRFWKRALLAYLVGVGICIATMVYLFWRMGEEFKAAIKD